MAWTAQLTKAETDPKSSFIIMTLTFSNDVTKETQTRVFPALRYDAEQIAVFCQSVITELEGRDADLVVVQALIGTPVQLPRDGFPTPRMDEAAASRATFTKIAELNQQLSKLNTLQSAVTTGLIAADDPDLLAMQKVTTASTASTASP